MKHQVQDGLVDLCMASGDPGQQLYIFSNDDVKRISSEVGFRNPFDATHIDCSRNRSMRMKEEDLFVVHLGTRVSGESAEHAFVRGSHLGYHSFEHISDDQYQDIQYSPGPLDEKDTSEANILSLVYNHGILQRVLYPYDLRAQPHIYMSHRSKMNPQHRVGDIQLPTGITQFEVDMTFEYDGKVTVFEGKNWSTNRDDFAVYQLYMPFRYFDKMRRERAGGSKILDINCCYVLRRKHSWGSEITAHVYTFTDPDDMASIELVEAKGFRLRRKDT